MKTRPILFSAPMVRAILSGAKTQTRRVVKIAKLHEDAGEPHPEASFVDNSYSRPLQGGVPCLKVPYGTGDDLTIHRHFPRWEPGDRLWVRASRITLEITAIRVERLQEISVADAIAEGIIKKGDADFISTIHPVKGTWQRWPDARTAYKMLWDSINGEESWASNPWCWIIEFKKV